MGLGEKDKRELIRDVQEYGEGKPGKEDVRPVEARAAGK